MAGLANIAHLERRNGGLPDRGRIFFALAEWTLYWEKVSDGSGVELPSRPMELYKELDS